MSPTARQRSPDPNRSQTEEGLSRSKDLPLFYLIYSISISISILISIFRGPIPRLRFGEALLHQPCQELPQGKGVLGKTSADAANGLPFPVCPAVVGGVDGVGEGKALCFQGADQPQVGARCLRQAFLSRSQGSFLGRLCAVGPMGFLLHAVSPPFLCAGRMFVCSHYAMFSAICQ